MKKIIIISECFAPNNKIAAIRTTKLAKYFKLKQNYNITVISRALRNDEIVDPILSEDLKYVDNHIIVGHSKYMKNLFKIRERLIKVKHTKIDTTVSASTGSRRSKKTIRSNLINSRLGLYIRVKFNEIIEDLEQKDFIRLAYRQVGENLDFDLILSSHDPYSSHMIASKIKRNNPEKLWIADFRDPVLNPFTPEGKLGFYKSYIKNVSKNADVFTGVTKACLKGFEKQQMKQCYVICNGFDRDDLKNVEIVSNSQFTLTYTGLLYQGKRDLSIIFKALRELIEEGNVDGKNVLINYAGRSESDFIKQIEKYNLRESSRLHGFVDREQSLQLQLSSNILLLASWNNSEDTGVVTGKFLEYLMMNKPIVCAITGDLPNSQLKEMIKEANNGVIWEEANDEVDYPILKSYILEQYQSFMNSQPPLFEPNLEYIEQYNYKNIAQQFIDIIEKQSTNA